MFSKAKRFEPIAAIKNQAKVLPKENVDKPIKKITTNQKTKAPLSTPSKHNVDTLSQCSSVQSTKSFVTPKPVKPTIKSTNSLKSTAVPRSNTKVVAKVTSNAKLQEDFIKSHEAEIRNKDYTINEYNKQIDDLKNEMAGLHKLLKELTKGDIDINTLNKKFNELTLIKDNQGDGQHNSQDLELEINNLEKQCHYLEQELNNKQVELTSLEEVITIRDSLCSDLQKKLTDMESCLEETKQRLEMVKGHHALALEANESIRREYKLELETLRSKMEEEKQNIISKCKSEQEITKIKYNTAIETIKKELLKEKDDKIYELQQQVNDKDQEMRAKLEQIDESTREKLRLCEIQFDERSRNIQEHWEQQQKELQELHNETKELKYTLSITEDRYNSLLKEVNKLKDENEMLKSEKLKTIQQLEDLREENKKKHIDFENEINKLTVDVDKAIKEKNKFEMSLSVTRDIVQVLTMRLRESDNELEHLESQVQTLTNSKDVLEEELSTYKNSLNNTLLECNEYKEALVNILKSKAALAKEHNRIMEHNVSLIESLQNVEKEAYRELGTIKNELIEDVELLKKESNSQIKILRDEVEKKRMLCELATEHAGQATAAAEQSRVLLAQAAAEIARLEKENHCLQQQIQDQQSLVVELSLLRQENEELTMNVAKQSSLLDKMKKEAEQIPVKPKSPAVMRKAHKIGKENVLNIISPLRERNH